MFDKNYNAYKIWRGGNDNPNELEVKLMGIVRTGLATIFYQNELYEYVKSKADFIPDEVWTIENGTVNGLMGFIIYSMRGDIERDNAHKDNLKSVVGYHVGQNIGTIYVNGKRYFKATITKIIDGQLDIKMTTGRYLYSFSTGAKDIQHNIDRAVERGWRRTN